MQFVVKYYLQSLIYNHLNIAYILGWEDLKILDTHRALALFPKSRRARWGPGHTAVLATEHVQGRNSL